MKVLFVWILLISSSCIAQDELPMVNQKVLEFCTKSMNKKVDRGECWDLAKFALDYANASWEFPFNFGEIVDPDTDEILPGDVLQFKNVKMGDGSSYPQHTAIVYEVLSKGKYLVAHQNFNNVRKVKTRELDLSLLKKGKIDFYRPIANK